MRSSNLAENSLTKMKTDLNIPPTTETLQQIQARIDASKTEHEASVKALKARAEEISEHERPIYLLLEKHRLLAESISTAEGQRDAYLAQDREFQQVLDGAFATGQGGNLYMFIKNVHPNAPIEERLAREASRWIKAQQPRVPELEKEIAKVCKERNLKHLLPEHLSHLAK